MLSRLIFFGSTAAAYTWPSPLIDALEKAFYEQQGQELSSPAFGVEDCSIILPDTGPQKGRTNAAEWVRTAYHDMATANVAEGTGGIDASIGFEYLTRPENAGQAFKQALEFFTFSHSPLVSMSDLIAMGAVLALGSCSNGAVNVPFRGGRIDATGPGQSGVPQPQEDLVTHTQSFTNQGFNITEMIGLVACGHTLGGVHGVDFPDIVPVTVDPTQDDNRQDFDDTFAIFDNRVAQQFVANETQNALAFGHNETTRSDFRIFNADGGVLIRKMAESNDFFLATCASLVERMVNTVPAGVELTEPITPIVVKPEKLSIKINAENATMTLSGNVRIMNDGRTSTARQVFLDFSSRDPVTCDIATSMPCVYTAQAALTASWIGVYAGLPTFIVYHFTTTVPTSVGVASFTVRLVDGDTVINETNNGLGFPFSDVLLPQLDLSCNTFDNGTNQTLTLTVAVRDDAQVSDILLSVPWQMEQEQSPSVARFDKREAVMFKGAPLEGTGYSLWKGVVTDVANKYTFLLRLYYDVFATVPTGTVSNTFNDWRDVQGSSCS